MMMMMIIIIIIITTLHICKETGVQYNWTKNTGMRMCQKQYKQVKEAR